MEALAQMLSAALAVQNLDLTAPASLQAESPHFGGIRAFTMTYRYEDKRTDGVPGVDEDLHIHGYEPIDGTGHPVYLHGGGASDRNFSGSPERGMAYEMARRGFVAAIMEMPMMEGMSFVCDGAHESLLNVSRRIFGYDGPGDTRSTALAAMCRRDTADCTAGIALHGLSFGGMLSGVGARFASGHVTAELRWSSGAFVPGGWGCCGRFSHDQSCCSRTARALPTWTTAGDDVPCVRDVETSRFLDRRRRRLILAVADAQYGDAMPDPSLTGDDFAYPRLANCTIVSEGRPDTLANQSRLVSGRECDAHELDCLAPSGWGHYAVTERQVDGSPTGLQQHNFHLHYDPLRPDEAEAGEPPQHTAGYYLSPKFMNRARGGQDVSSQRGPWEPWEMKPSFDWLAATAKTPRGSLRLG